MKKFIEKLRTEDWVAVWVAIPLLIMAALYPTHIPSVPSTLIGEVAWYNIALLFGIVAVITYVGLLLLKRPVKGVLLSLVAVFALSLVAQVLAKIDFIKYYGFEAVFFSVLLGLLVRNVWHVPEWMKPAIQGEFFIKIGVVCLGATILINDVMKSGVFGLFQACFVVSCVWFFAYWYSRRQGVDRPSAMILSSGLSICGVSAAITAARATGTNENKLPYIVSLILIVVVPMIYLMPWLANTILPMIFDDPEIVDQVAGAWIGGTIDTTSGVAASSTILGDAANGQAMIIKGTQNVLIGVVAFFIALYLSTHDSEGTKQRPSLGIVWEKFPKFILGFVAASLVFSMLQTGGYFTEKRSTKKQIAAEQMVEQAEKTIAVAEATPSVEMGQQVEVLPEGAAVSIQEQTDKIQAAEPATIKKAKKYNEPDVAKMFSTLFFSIAFVCIGLDTRLKDIISKQNRNVLRSFLVAQTFNIFITLLVACLMFGVLKPLWM